MIIVVDLTFFGVDKAIFSWQEKLGFPNRIEKKKNFQQNFAAKNIGVDFFFKQVDLIKV